MTNFGDAVEAISLERREQVGRDCPGPHGRDD
jgi:hypothetical protein